MPAIGTPEDSGLICNDYSSYYQMFVFRTYNS